MSISAHGEIAVYPRPRGGAPRPQEDRPAVRGLSPPTRGSQSQHIPVQQIQRSIPAHAGEPGAGGGIFRARRVYPRPRGGAGTSDVVTGDVTGLSPPTRGSLGGFGHGRRQHRSIPAHAGEPP